MEYNEQKKELMKGTKLTDSQISDTETEDEEVKKNCYGMKFYSTTSCSEDETESQITNTDSEDDDDTSTDGNESSSTLSTCTESDLSGDEMEESSASMPQPTKFTFDLSKCEPGISICRPKPVSFRKKLQEYNFPNDEEDLCAQSIEDEDSDTSEEEESDAEVSKVDNLDDGSSVSSTSTGSSNSIEQEEETIPRTISTSASWDSHDDSSKSDHYDNDAELDLGEEDSSDNTVGTDTEDESESVASSLEGDGSVVSTKIDEHQSSEDDEKEVEIEWDDVLNQKLDFGTHQYDEDTIVESLASTATEESSISAKDLENIMYKTQDDSSSDMSFSDETGNRSDRTVPRLSCPTEQAKVESSKSGSEVDSAGKQDSSPGNKRSHSTAFGPTRFLPLLKADSSVLSNFEFFKWGKTKNPAASSCCSDSDVDSQLAEELLGSGSLTPLESKPIPLLTPPASPVPIKSDESVVEIYEWPSGLAVDNALTAAIQLRPLSPSSLAKLEEDEQLNESFITPYPKKIRSVTRDFSYAEETGFTPVLKGMGICGL